MLHTTQKLMTIEEWSLVQDCPIQRDTERHAEKAKKSHLKELAETHYRVSAAILPNGAIYKLDGHTRALLWGRNELERPPALLVDLYPAKDLDHVEKLYKQFDNKNAVEGTSDKKYGAFRQQGFTPSSNLIKHGGLVYAMDILASYSGTDRSNIYSTIGFWIDDIQIIDQRAYSNSDFPSALVAALLVTVKADGEQAFKFWDSYSQGDGVKQGRERCPVQALLDVVHEKRMRNQMGGRANTKDLLGKAISCYEMHKKGGSYVTGVKTTNPDSYIPKALFRGKTQ